MGRIHRRELRPMWASTATMRLRTASIGVGRGYRRLWCTVCTPWRLVGLFNVFAILLWWDFYIGICRQTYQALCDMVQMELYSQQRPRARCAPAARQSLVAGACGMAGGRCGSIQHNTSRASHLPKIPIYHANPVLRGSKEALRL